MFVKFAAYQATNHRLQDPRGHLVSKEELHMLACMKHEGYHQEMQKAIWTACHMLLHKLHNMCDGGTQIKVGKYCQQAISTQNLREKKKERVVQLY